LEKINRTNQLIECFCNNFSINKTAKFLGLNYQTVANEYKNIRENIANFLETQYVNKEVLEYDEYLYLEKSKKTKEKFFEAKNFLTFHYEDKVYNILMPNIARYKDIEPKDFSRFMSLHKISKLEKKETTIQNFWEFFENSILKYKGVKEENFFYYLKEIEFKFNYLLEEQLKILEDIR